MNEVKLRVKDVFKDDIGKSTARIDPEIFSETNLNTGEIINITSIISKKSTGAYIFPSNLKDKATRVIRIDANLRRNLSVKIDDIVRIKKTKINLAQQVSFAGFQKGIILKKPKVSELLFVRPILPLKISFSVILINLN